MSKKFTKVQNTRHSLIMSILALILCLAMFIGTTYAWFTDSVTSGTNKIVAGNLDIDLEYTTDETFAIVVYMPEEVGNEANYKTGTTAPSIDLGVKLVATQDTVEADSFDKKYDAVAWIVANADTTAGNATDLTNALKQGGSVALTNDITGNLTLDKNADTVRICSFGQEANVILMGGTFNVQPSKSATIAAGYKEVDNGNGTWTVMLNN